VLSRLLIWLNVGLVILIGGVLFSVIFELRPEHLSIPPAITLPVQPSPLPQPAGPQLVSRITYPDTLVYELTVVGSGYSRQVAYGRVSTLNLEKHEIVLQLNQIEEKFLLGENIYVCRLVRTGNQVTCAAADLTTIELGRLVELSAFESLNQSVGEKTVNRIMIPS